MEDAADSQFLFLVDVEGYHTARNSHKQFYEDAHDVDWTDEHGQVGDEVECVDEFVLRGAEGSYLCTAICIHGT